MSIARQFLREFRPLFRLLEEPFGGSPRYGRLARPAGSFFEDPLLFSPRALRPAVDVTEEGNKYIIEAELPGVKKEDVEVRVGDGGRSLTIEGKIVDRRTYPAAGAQPSEKAGAEAAQQNLIATEREFVGNTTFTRTVLLPQPVKAENVVAKLKEGVLTVAVPKAEDSGSVTIPVE
ncbi:unnamed protein product [Somion occarium]|uniref:SHSP domain-containing protein n=1 Tax=Somion occarium TaxID=3059160 RepID=A0ABP1DZJ2_9APHY